MSYDNSRIFFDSRSLHGLMETHVVDSPLGRIHPDVVEPLMQLREAAQAEGFDLRVASAFRPFDRQLAIWNQKASGQRPLLDVNGAPLSVAGLSSEQILFAILHWSALPGASRHHWGTDLDVYDHHPVAGGYKLQLTVAETQGQGVMAGFHDWLSGYLLSSEVGFFRPYGEGSTGIAPEPWHLSWAPTAAVFQRRLDAGALRDLLQSSDIALKPCILRHFDDIFRDYVWVPWSCYPQGVI